MRTEGNFYAHKKKFSCARKYFFVRTKIYCCALAIDLEGEEEGAGKGRSAFALAGKETQAVDLATDRKGIAEARHGEDP